MNDKVLKTLEFDKIRDMLTEKAYSEPAKKMCSELKPSTEKEIIDKNIKETSDALTHMLTHGELSFSTVDDVRDEINRLKIGASLSAPELLKLAHILSSAGEAKAYFREKTGDSDNTEDSLNPYYKALSPLTNVKKKITDCIPAPDMIADDASPNLLNIRRSLRTIDGKIHDTLHSILKSNAEKMQDQLITIRDNRYCIPVKAEFRSSIKGIVHDRSQTGITLFIEPDAVVKINNEKAEYEAKEAEEITKILAELSNMCAEYMEEIVTDSKTLIKLDFIFAKAALSREMKGTRPIFTDDYIELKQARHPLLDKKTCVPIDVHLGRDFTLLVITGPNTGGKTVSLKTVGLLSLMGQAGLHIPAFDNSKLKLFKEIYADIGDEQSIEQSLSTFSSHMVNTVSILKNADENSLILFDELGAGTDPEEGAALAKSILMKLHRIGAYVIATTHYSELKLYALSTPGVLNASCEFDVNRLAPTYKLLIGVPGKSNAFAISKKLGLPEDIIEAARENITEEEADFEDMIHSLDRSRAKLEKERAELAAKRKELSAMSESVKRDRAKLDSSKKRILDNANREASEILLKAKETADETIKKFSKWAKENPDIREMEESRRKLNENIKKKNEAKETVKPRINKKIKAEDLKIGMDVHIISMNTDGTVNTLPDKKGNLFVTTGIMRIKVSLQDLEIIKPKKQNYAPANSNMGNIRMAKSKEVKGEVNLIGMDTLEAIRTLEKYLDDAYLANMSQVNIIHGRGTGALKNAVHDYLKKQKYVKSYRLGEFGEGSGGVTIVEL
ncbi:MAG: endonuclease MutS2 [Lachnospiraceae bacterium]|nr:endonuclease MutS2 [Lachnospiraceae bacterium]